MGIVDKFLNIAPCHCQYCLGASIAMMRLSDEARWRGINTTEMLCSQAVHDPVWAALSAQDPLFVNGFGHGNDTTYTGDTTTMIFDVNNCSILGGRIVYLLSCSTANQLGPAIIAAGGIAYGGYRVDWTWIANDTGIDTYLDWYAEGFYRASDQFPLTLLEGGRISEARDRSIAEYNRWINIWETERSGDEFAADAIKWLLWDRDGLTVLGNTSARIVHPGADVAIPVDSAPPAEAEANTPIRITGRLTEKNTGVPISRKPVQLLVDGNSVATFITGADGAWAFSITLSGGWHGLVARFAGDAIYGERTSQLFVVEVGVTIMNVTKQPPPSIEPGRKFVFSGVLTDKMTGLELPNEEVDLYINDVVSLSTSTNAYGIWTFSIILNTTGETFLSARFKGDEYHMENSTDEYRVMVGLPAIFGNNQYSAWGTYTNDFMYGSPFVCPNGGTALNITAWCFDSDGIRKAKCAIYRVSDCTLVGQTEELTVSSAQTWKTFNFLNPKPTLVAGETYYLVIWFQSGSGQQFHTGHKNLGVSNSFNWPLTYTGNFPAVWTPLGPDVFTASIYCTYQAANEQTLTILTPSGAGTTDPAPGTYYYLNGDTATVTASPSTGYVFDHWLLNGVSRTDNPINFLMDGNYTLQAVFVTAPKRVLTINSAAGGTTDPTPGSYQYDSGTTAEVIAYPSSGYTFDHWVLDGTMYLDNPIYILMSTNHTLTPVFTQIPTPQHYLTISSTTGGTTNPAPGVYVYDEGTTALVGAIPNSGYVFDHWVLDGVTRMDNPISIIMSTDHNVTAYFTTTPPTQYTLTITAGTGGTTNPVPGSYLYNAGTTATVTASPSSGYVFDHWALDGVTHTENPINILMNANHSLTAVFAVIPPTQYTLTITATTGGTTNPVPGSYLYNAGAVATVTATPSSGYQFDHWVLDGTIFTTNPISFTMNANATLAAVFAVIPPTQYTLTITAGTGGTTYPPPGSYNYSAGTTVRVTAYPDSGYRFARWEIDSYTSTSNPIDVLLDKNYTLHAVFEVIPAPERMLTTSATEGGTTNPAPGSYYYADGSIAQAIAFPDSGYIFDHWLLDGTTRVTDNPISVLMDSDHTLAAVFIVAPPISPYRNIAIAAGVASVAGLVYLGTRKK